MVNHDHHDAASTPSFWRSPVGMCLLVALAVPGFYVVTEHTAHAMAALPCLLFLACPPMHVFVHRGHGGHPGHGTRQASRALTEGLGVQQGDESFQRALDAAIASIYETSGT